MLDFSVSSETVVQDTCNVTHDEYFSLKSINTLLLDLVQF